MYPLILTKSENIEGREVAAWLKYGMRKSHQLVLLFLLLKRRISRCRNSIPAALGGNVATTKSPIAPLRQRPSPRFADNAKRCHSFGGCIESFWVGQDCSEVGWLVCVFIKKQVGGDKLVLLVGLVFPTEFAMGLGAVG